MPTTATVSWRGNVFVERVRVATRWRDRSRGLLGSERLERDEGLLIDRARQVHTFGMRFSIDVVFCDRDFVVQHVVRCLRPARVTRIIWRARYVFELPCGSTPAELQVGERLGVSRREVSDSDDPSR